jgi:oxygen-independent coproporphyrinogen-3 oxidase
MAGIYIHVPFCKKKCDYCDFYSVVDSGLFTKFVDAVNKEIALRAKYLSTENIETIYFGGGTPSLLTSHDIEKILKAIYINFNVSKEPEITIEANPDDLSFKYLEQLFAIGVNRLSIGVQSFCDNDLIKLGRRHNASQAATSVVWANDVGFTNISIDLIYGLPYSTTKIWADNLRIAFELPIKHLSSYHLIYEEGTPLHRMLLSGSVLPVNEEKSVAQFKLLQEVSARKGFIQYEISNFSPVEYYSKHNTSYWKQKPYLGVGPSAHSYNGLTRDWNPKSHSTWIKEIDEGRTAYESEFLSQKDKLNEYLLTSLRTIWGIDIDLILSTFGESIANEVLHKTQKHLKNGVLERDGKRIRINPSHYLISDGIIADFFIL